MEAYPMTSTTIYAWHNLCISQSIIVASSERAKTPQWDCIPEENCILDKDTLSWIMADDDTENSPDIPGSAKRLKLEDRSTTSKRI